MEKIALALNALPGGLHRPLRKIWEEGSRAEAPQGIWALPDRHGLQRLRGQARRPVQGGDLMADQHEGRREVNHWVTRLINFGMGEDDPELGEMAIGEISDQIIEVVHRADAHTGWPEEIPRPDQ